MAIIVNLSAIHKLHPISKSVEAFVKLCNKYPSSCFDSCPTLFNSWSNYAWVMYQLHKNEKGLIQSYKLGNINTADFLKNLLEIFSFLKKIEADHEAMDNLNQGESYSQSFPEALLESAWNGIIDLDDAYVSHFSRLAERASFEPVYLISNTNELNVLKILRLLKKHNPQINFKESIDLSVQRSKEPIEIAPNIFLCLSYRYQLFKTESQNSQGNSNSTTSLLKHLIQNDLSDNNRTKINDRTKIQVVSNYNQDLIEARKFIPGNNVHKADEFFKELLSETKKIN